MQARAYKWAGADLNRRHTDFQSVAQAPEVVDNAVLKGDGEGCVQSNVQRSNRSGPAKEQQLPPDLAEIVTVWPDLPGYIRQTIKLILDSYMNAL